MDQNTRRQDARSRRRGAALVGAISVVAAGTALVAAATHGPPADAGRTLAAVGAIATTSAVPPPGAPAPSSATASTSATASASLPAGPTMTRSSLSAAPSAPSAPGPAGPSGPTPQVKRRAEWGEPVEGAAAEAAVRLVADYLAAADRAYAGLDAAAFANDRIAVGPARGEIEAGVAELEHADRRQDGAVSIAAASVFTQKQKQRLLVVACLDSSAVRVVEGDRTAVRAAAPAGTRRDLHEFLLQRTGDRWVVHTHAMPIDTSCGR